MWRSRRAWRTGYPAARAALFGPSALAHPHDDRHARTRSDTDEHRHPPPSSTGLRISARDLGNEHGILYYSTPETTTYRGYADLDERARAASRTRSSSAGYGVGDIVVLGVSDALTVADAAFGAMYAGLAFVPAPVSGPAVAARYWRRRVARIATAAEASLLLVDAAVLARLGDGVAEFGVPVLVLEDLLAEGDPDAWTAPPIDGDTIAYLLFTSGSTGDPKGVITTHRGVVETARACVPLFGTGPDRDHGRLGADAPHHGTGHAGALPGHQRRPGRGRARPSCSSAGRSSGCS